MAEAFEDNFSRQAREYARHRPSYPPELFAFIAACAPAHETAWDCGTGNGQAARGMANHFAHVIATDASSNQIAQAEPHERISFHVAPAERSGLAAESIDALSVATAMHWFNLEGFYAEARRVLRPGGVIAVWSYFNHSVDERIDPVVKRFGHEIVGPYWSEKLRAVNRSYASLPFPFEEIEHPAYVIEASWSLNDLVGYLCSWSATQKFIEAHGRHPIEEIRAELADAWGPEETRHTVRWPLTMRVGRRE